MKNLAFTLKTTVATCLVLATLANCNNNGQNYAANVYKSGQVNQQQDAQTVTILAVLPAKVEVDNAEAKKNAQLIGGVLGAVGGGVLGGSLTNRHNTGNGAAVGAVGGGTAGVAAGSLVSDKVLVDGVSITYVVDGRKKPINSVQVGRKCEFVKGAAIMISTENRETRIQPNNECVEDLKKGN